MSAAATDRESAERSQLAETIVSHVSANGVHRSRRMRMPENGEINAPLRYAPNRAAVLPFHPCSRANIDAVVDELIREVRAYRFQLDQRPLGGAGGTFVLCGLLMALADHDQRRSSGARFWFDLPEHQTRDELPRTFVNATESECARRVSLPLARL